MSRARKQSIKMKDHLLRLVIIFDDLTGGGAARVATILANAWVAKDFDVTLLTTDDGSVRPAYRVNELVKLFHLDLRRESHSLLDAVINNCFRIRQLRIAMRRLEPDVIISFLDRNNVLTLLASLRLGVPIIVSERTDPAGLKPGRAWELLRRLTYPWADAVVCQGERPLRYFGQSIRRRGRVIPNPVMIPSATFGLRADSTCPRKVRTLATLGRLGPEKGYDVLLAAFSRVAPQHPEWHLTIWGEGQSRPALEAQVKRLGIADRVALPGVTREPSVRLAEADIFVLSSRAEGFPNVLCEAMAVGLPVIATDVGAVSEIVRDGLDGLQVPPNDVDALAAAIDRLMSSPEERQWLAARAPEVLQRFSLEKVIGLWEDLFCEVTGRNNL